MNKPPRAVGLTGTPCTGKKTVAPLVASELGLRVLELNSLARRLYPTGDELEVDVRRLRSLLKKEGGGAASVVSGHLLSAVMRKGELDFVAVLRCDPMTLKGRLLARGYDQEKVVENLEAELIGVVLDEAVRTFGADCVHEYDTTRARPAATARRIASDLRSGASSSAPWIDWTLDYDSTSLRSLLSPASTEPAST